MKRVSIPLLALAIAHSAVALAGPKEDAFDRLRQGMSYAEARGVLLAGGWQAVRYPWMTAEARCGFREEICKDYPETNSCAGTGLGQCKFVFRDGRGGYLSVITVGEELPDLAIDAWFLEDEEPAAD